MTTPDPLSAAVDGPVAQRADDDCTVCCISMATGLPYETVMEAATRARGGYRYQGRPGTGSPRAVLIELGFAAKWLQVGTLPADWLRRLLWGRRAILSVPSLNGYAGHHDVYWDGEHLFDPSPKVSYPDDLAAVTPEAITIVQERSALSAAITAFIQASGMVLVPREPTEAMLCDGVNAPLSADDSAGEAHSVCDYIELPSEWAKLGAWDRNNHPRAPLFASVLLATAYRAMLSAAPAATAPYQQRVQNWMLACFGADIANNRTERAFRFLEEALELAQSIGVTADEARTLIDYTFARPIGDPAQEVGGVMVTLATLCTMSGIDLDCAAEAELARVWTKIEKIRAKHAAKPKDVRTALPGDVPAPAVEAG